MDRLSVTINVDRVIAGCVPVVVTLFCEVAD